MPSDPIKLIHASVNAWPQQFKQAAAEAKKIKLPRKPSRLISCGMGGSGIGARILASVIKPDLKIPFEIVADYSLPPLDKKSVVIAASYSGNTEETLACAQEAYRKKYPLIVMGVGGKLLSWAAAKKIPKVSFDPRHNPSRQPRLGLGYSLGALATLLNRWHFIKPVFPLNSRSLASGISEKLRGKIILVFGADHLAEVARLGAYYFNETAKQFAFALPLPEADHHILEAKIPQEQIAALFLNAPYENSQHKKRLSLTSRLLETKGIKTATLWASGESRFAQSWNMASQLGHLSARLATQNKVNPTQLLAVEDFKKRL